MSHGREFQAHVVTMQIQEMLTGELTWWWLSFCDSTRPTGQHFLGACMVQAFGLGTAVAEAHRRKINPGGEVMGLPIPEHAPEPLPEWTNRLLTKAECEAYDTLLSIKKGVP